MGTLAERIAAAQSGSTGVTPSGPLTVSNLTDEDRWGRVSAYMEDRAGMTEKDYSREEIRDAFVNSMRGFNSGNSIDVVQEMNYLYRGDSDKELEQRRGTAAEAYDLWDSLGGAFNENTTAGEKLDAVGDYARSIILDPVNAVSLGVGKLAATAATKTSTLALKEVARAAGKAAAKNAVTKGASKKVAEQAGNAAMQKTMRDGFSRLGVEQGKSITKKAIVADIAGSAAFDSAAAVGADAGIQSVDRMVGRQEGYNAQQGGLNALMGAAGGALAGGFVMARGIGNLDSTGKAIARETEKLEAVLTSMSDAKNAAKRIDADAATKSVDSWLTDFQEVVERGRWVAEGEAPTTEVFTTELNQTFMSGLSKMLSDGGIPIDALNASRGERRAGWYWDTINSPDFPSALKTKIDDAFETTVGTTPGNTTPDLKSWLELNAETASQAGKTLRANRAKYDFFEAAGAPLRGSDDVVGDITKVLGDPATDGLADKAWGALADTQHKFIRMLVTHPATTMLNVVGWANASAMQSYSDMIRGTLYGGASVVKNLVGDSVGAAQYRKSAGHMFRIQKQKFQNLLDYQSTKEEALEYLTHRPEAQETLFRYLAGGVESKDLVTKLNLKPGEKMSQTKIEKGMELMQTAYGVNAQDMLTKTQEFMYALDKQISLKYGQSFNEFMARDDILDLLTDPKKGPAFKDYAKMEGLALEQALGSVFARKLGDRKEKGLLNFVANTIEEVRNVPVIGALLPFGQFFNNTIAFMADHVGVTLMMRGVGVSSRDPMELLAKSAAGWSTIGWATAKEVENLNNGLAWHEERNSDGKVVSRLYDFPLSFWKMIGRMGAHILRDGEVPVDLLKEGRDTFTLDAVTRSLDDTAAQVWKTMEAFASGEVGEGKDALVKSLESITGMYSSGFTRFLEPINSALAMSEGEDYVEPTRKIGNKGLNNAIRYTDQILDSLIGLENLPFDTEGYDVEQYSATNNRDMGVNPGKLGGSREVAVQSSIGRLFNDIGKPQWQTEMRVGNPRMQEVFDKYVFPLLEYRADSIMESGSWDNLSMKRKQKALGKILSGAKADVKKALAASGGDKAKVSLVMDINARKAQGKHKYYEMLEIFEVDEETIDDLALPQLRLLLDSLKSTQKTEKNYIKSITQ